MFLDVCKCEEVESDNTPTSNRGDLVTNLGEKGLNATLHRGDLNLYSSSIICLTKLTIAKRVIQRHLHRIMSKVLCP